MKILTIFLLLGIAPIIYADQPISDVIQNIHIQGVSLSTDITKSPAILVQKGFESVSQSNKGSLLSFKKEDCQITLQKRPTGSLISYIRYECNKHEDTDIKHALATLCDTKNNGKNNREGCSPTKPNKYGLVRETFEHPEITVDGYQYLAKINMLKKHSSSIVISVIAAKTNIKSNISVIAKFPTAVVGASNKNIKEANQAYEHCKKNSMRLTQDCGCFADEFLKKRIDYGFQGNSDQIYTKLTTSCLKVETTAAHASCMRFREIHDINMTPKKYCSCYAERYSDLVENFKGKKLSFNQKQSFKSQARGHCRDIDRKMNK